MLISTGQDSSAEVNLNLAIFKLSPKIGSGNAFKQENQKPWTTFNSRSALIGFQTTGPGMFIFSFPNLTNYTEQVPFKYLYFATQVVSS